MQRDFEALADECRGRVVRLAALALREFFNVVWAGVGERIGRARFETSAAYSRRGRAMINDLKFALRSLRRSLGLSAAVLLTMGLGIGVTTAVFSVVDHVLLRPLPYPDPERLVRVWGADRQSGQRHQELSFQDFEAIRRQVRSYEAAAAFSTAPRRLSGSEGHPAEVTVARVSEGFFEMLAARFERGRGFSPDEFRRRERAVVLSHRLWQSRYGGQDAALGAQFELRGESHRIIGVLPQDWEYPTQADLFRPLSDAEMEDDDREFFVLARLAPGASLEAASAESAAVIERLADADPQRRGRHTGWAQPLQAMLVRDVRTPLLMLLAAVGAVLLIVCLNVSNLLLARGISRRPEMALRSALGAGRGRLLALNLWESLLLACGGALLGLGLGYGVLQVLIALAPEGIPRLDALVLDLRIAAVMAAVALTCGLAAGLFPAWLDSNPRLRSAFAGNQTAGESRRGSRVRRGLVAVEVALATVLVVTAALLASSFRHMVEFERGFTRLSVLEIPVGLSQQDAHSSSEALRDLFSRMQGRLESLPGVRSVALSSFSPMRPAGLRVPLGIEGVEVPAEQGRVQLRFVSHDFFSAAGIPILEGRSFDPAIDHASGVRTAIVNRAFADAYLPEAARMGVGRRILLPTFRQGEETEEVEVVGVAADLRPSVDSLPRPAVYVPFQQRTWAYMRLLVQFSGDPVQAVPMLREQIWRVAPDATLERIATLDQMVAQTLAGPRFSAALVGSFALLALLLAAVGIYGVVSYFVTRQARELALRRALGAREGGMAWLVLRRGLGLVLVGAAVGLPAAASAAWLLSSQLYQVRPGEPLVYLLTIAALSAAGTLASLLPVRRALLLDAAAVLREQ